jgi:hypothetical protein
MLVLLINVHLGFAIMFNDLKQTYEILKLDKKLNTFDGVVH